MTPEAQRIAIAEACGYKRTPVEPSVKLWYHFAEDLPDYLNDLNAMHEAEKVLTQNQRFDYYASMRSACDRDASRGNDVKNMIHATAAQRAEALLRALGLWTEGNASSMSASAGERRA